MIYLIICVVAWLGFGLFQAGKQFAANQEDFAIIAKEEYKSDQRWAYSSILMGFPGFVATWIVYGFHHKWRLK